MDTSEKIAFLDKFISTYWGTPLAEHLWHESCYCVNDTEYARLYDIYFTD